MGEEVVQYQLGTCVECMVLFLRLALESGSWLYGMGCARSIQLVVGKLLTLWRTEQRQ